LTDINASIATKLTTPGAWTPYTTTWSAVTTQPVLGNGTLTARYQLIGKTVNWMIQLNMGTTTTYGAGLWGFSLPLLPRNHQPVGQVRCFDASASTNIIGVAAAHTASVDLMRLLSTAGTVSPAVPFTWANLDILSMSGSYETT
jgi:hypothetical protein